MPTAKQHFLTLAVLLFLTLSNTSAKEEQKDHYPDCKEWATAGHCQFGHTRSDYMMKWCTKSCIEVLDIQPATTKHLEENDQLFFEMEAKDVFGKVIDFERFEGYVTIVVNAARDCLNSDVFYSILEHYRSIYPYTVEIIVFPFDHPTSPSGIAECPDAISQAEKNPDRKIHMMEVVDINGPNTHPLYKLLKKVFGLDEIKLDRPYYFFVNPDGDVMEMHYGAGLNNLKDYVARHAKTDL
mmetsp:Transcript_15189/g.20734  ORF Transcript_15189/g.20734 Transcript_15189/m.20734 type:complete len:240 (-) Transcript_15189:345-1064(-)|eukprot:CAMPEP_0185731388 /NCGR_PEP_ID=MMETSP1171-20130828/12780_1 /TAXON_ID=374046 /ORGANISM="Helicotheca tamensis, Strain CCMP826" /LENGTH=239 /DNA_ID=CAMNT_0028400647 /DNA_START=100 /DNA_END=819 /DNA_ORIENTATION=+